CRCGRNFDLFDQVEGRWEQEYLVGAKGSLISLAALNMHGPVFERVVRYQYYQDTPGVMILKLQVLKTFSESDQSAIERAFRNKTGEELSVKVAIVESIPLTTRGKLRRLVQQLPT